MIKKNILIRSKNESYHPYLVVDINLPHPGAPVVIFVHGFKGFKDWGCWELVEKFFVEQKFNFVKFNFSKNGTTEEKLMDFVDLDSFAHNTISLECEELKQVIDYLDRFAPSHDYYLIGHSLGGGVSLIVAQEDQRIKKLATWASIPDFKTLFQQIDLKKWQEEKTIYLKNQRTQQMMAIHYSFYLDYLEHQERLDLPRHIPKITIPTLVVHGEEDATVEVSAAHSIYTKLSLASKELYLLHCSHSFNANHPWESNDLPQALREICQKTQSFFRE